MPVACDVFPIEETEGAYEDLTSGSVMVSLIGSRLKSSLRKSSGGDV